MDRRDAQDIATLREYSLKGLEDTGKELGRGSYAVVCEMSYHGLRCASKKLYPCLYEQRIGDVIHRFAQECRLLSRVRHPNIVQFLGVHFEKGSIVPALVMEYHPMTLAQRIDMNPQLGAIPDEIVYPMAVDVALGLNYLHSQPSPIVHRDLSANNVLLSKDLTAKISDLGVAKIIHLNPQQLKQKMTKTPGTPCYMPPEAQEDNPQYGTSVDTFSYGILLIHIFSGEWPFPTKAVKVDPDTEELIALSEAQRRQQNLDKLSPDHPLMNLILRCISNTPTSRPTSAIILQSVKEVEARFPPVSKEEILIRVKRLSVSLQEAEERAKRKILIQKRSERFEALEKANKELDTAFDNASATSDSLNQFIQQFQDRSSQMSPIVDELQSHFNPSKEKGGLCAEDTLTSMEGMNTCLERAQQQAQEKVSQAKAAQQSAEEYIAALETVKDKARNKTSKIEGCQESVQATISDLNNSEQKVTKRVHKLQETQSAVQELCTALEHIILVQESSSTDVDAIKVELEELHLTQEKVAKLLAAGV